MAIGWFICGYARDVSAPSPTRYCAMDTFTTMIRADGGDWREAEYLGNRAIVKVRASAGTLTTIAGTTGFRRIPLTLLDDPLSSLTAGQRSAIRNEILDAGYTNAEINAALPDLSTVTLRQVLQFITSRRLKPRYDSGTDTIICDGIVQPCTQPETIDGVIV